MPLHQSDGKTVRPLLQPLCSLYCPCLGRGLRTCCTHFNDRKRDEAVLLEWKELICFRTPKRTGDFAWIGLEFVKVVTWMLYPATINALGSGLSVVHF
ncbi:possible Fibronectin type I domain [Prochlorococcus marinus str. MIT 9313]|uniref:Possible Fibronectin type I domain n=1 Tax=Prochlorococcus marinus (strain MIT 9313) TaxID=74547 RepID=Q7TV24_PROMM|nr:possible Fibronectin type I domain [Prochlorococcus marinus str. MIT 9313]